MIALNYVFSLNETQLYFHFAIKHLLGENFEVFNPNEDDPLILEVNGGGGAANLSEDDLQFRPGGAPEAAPHYQTQAADLSLAGGGPSDSHHHHHPDLYGGLGLRYSGGGGNSPPTLAAHHQLYEDSFYTAAASADTSMDQVNYCGG
jgi:hypothetical protein